jgi:hypothetical protein
LLDLAAALHERGFLVEVADLLRISALETRLVELGQRPPTLDRAIAFLRPLVCRSARDIAEVNGILGLAAERGESANAGAAAWQSRGQPGRRKPACGWLPLAVFSGAIAAAAMLVLAARLTGLWPAPSPPRQVAPPVHVVAPAPSATASRATSPPKQTPAAGATPPFGPVAKPGPAVTMPRAGGVTTQPPPRGAPAPVAALTPSPPAHPTPWPWYMLAAAPLLATIVALLAGRRGRAAALVRRPGPSNALRQTLRLPLAAPPHFSGRYTTRALRAMTMHRRRREGRLDAHATVAASIRCGGLYTPVPATVPCTQEYLLLVDRAGERDHLAHVGGLICARMRRRGLQVDHFEFMGDPRVLNPIGRDGLYQAPVLLDDLVLAGPEKFAIMVADASCPFNLDLAQPRLWLETFTRFQMTALLAPNCPGPRDWRSRTLGRAGIAAYPTTPTGLAELSSSLTASARRAAARSQRARPGPLERLLADRPTRWTSDSPPSDAERRALADAIARSLSPDAALVLMATALCPLIHPKLTLELHARLADAVLGRVDEMVLAEICWLPWYRVGRMPDWLRAMLSAQLLDAPETAQAVRNVWLELFAQNDDSEAGLDLTLSRERARFRRRLLELIGAERSSLLKEQIFVDFIGRGHGERPLAFRVPDRSIPSDRPRTTPLEAALIASSLLVGAAIALYGPSLQPTAATPRHASSPARSVAGPTAAGASKVAVSASLPAPPGNVLAALGASQLFLSSRSLQTGLSSLVSAWQKRGDGDMKKLAYILATVDYETSGSFKPLLEKTASAADNYYGRGYVPMEFKGNYIIIGKDLGVDLVDNPDLALNPDIAAEVTIDIMMRGLATGHRLGDYFSATKSDWVGARAITGTGAHGAEIAAQAQQIYAVLTGAQSQGKRRLPIGRGLAAAPARTRSHAGASGASSGAAGAQTANSTRATGNGPPSSTGGAQTANPTLVSTSGTSGAVGAQSASPARSSANGTSPSAAGAQTANPAASPLIQSSTLSAAQAAQAAQDRALATKAKKGRRPATAGREPTK